MEAVIDAKDTDVCEALVFVVIQSKLNQGTNTANRMTIDKKSCAGDIKL